MSRRARGFPFAPECDLLHHTGRAQFEAGEGLRRLEHFGAALMQDEAYASNVGGIGTKPMFS